MKKIGICLLAYGDEHIKECLFLIENLMFYKKQIDFYVATNCVEKFKDLPCTKVFEITDDFNYNLKRIAVKEAFKDCDIIVMMDTDLIEHILYHGDTTTNKMIFHNLNQIENGIYSDVVDSFNLNLSHHYQKKVYELSDNYDGLLHLFEHIIILKITDDEIKQKFLDNWEYFYNETIDSQPLSLVTKLNGAMEGILIHGCSYKSGLKFTRIFDNPITNYLFCRFYHYNDVNEKIDDLKVKLRKLF